MKIFRLARDFLYKVAEREGFEPSIRDKPHTPLAGERLQPLGHLSVADKISLYQQLFLISY